MDLTPEQHQLLQTIFNASRTGHPCPAHVVAAASDFIEAGIVLMRGSADLSIPAEVQQALALSGQPLKTR